MNLMDEYEEALAAVKGIDFTYTDKKEIPLFETTIRYVGGLLGAYDMAAERGRDDKILVDQAGKLGQVLYGALAGCASCIFQPGLLHCSTIDKSFDRLFS